MKRFVLHLTVALLTSFLGWAATLIYPLYNSLQLATQSLPNIFPALPATESLSPPQEQVEFEKPPAKESTSIMDICTPKENLRYEEYEVASFFRPDTDTSLITIRKDGRLLAKIKGHDGGIMGRDGMRIGLFSLLGRETKQL